MGSRISTEMQNEVKEGQVVVNTMKNDMISQQVQLVRRMAERQMALQVASVRECLLWFVPFTVASYVFLYKGYRKTNSWPVTFPLLPITFALGYQLHYAYGSKTNKIKVLAEKIMAKEPHMMAVPEWSTDTSKLSLMQSTKTSTSNAADVLVPSVNQENEPNTFSHQVAFVSSAPRETSVITSQQHPTNEIVASDVVNDSSVGVASVEKSPAYKASVK